MGSWLHTTHIKNLREFLYDPARTNPLDIAVQNRGEFFIDSIHDYVQSEWLGYGPEHNMYTWEPYKNLAHTEQLIL